MGRILSGIGGFLALAVGLTGVVLSVLALLHSWTTAERLRREIPQALGDLEGIVGTIHQQGAATVTLLGAARERTAFIGTSIEELANRVEPPPARTSILETLDEDIGRRLESAEEFVLSMQLSMRSMSSALLVLDSVPFFGARSGHAGAPGSTQLRSVATGLTETADLLDQASQAIDRARAGQAIAPAQLEQVQETLRLLDRRLHEIQAEIHEFSDRIEQTRSTLAAMREDSPRWIETSAVAATVFFVCFGFTQISLLLHGARALIGAWRPGRTTRDAVQ